MPTLYAEVAQALAAPFPYRQLSWRLGSVNKATLTGQALPYIDARTVEDRLDQVLGIENWRDEYIEVSSGNRIVSVRCRLHVRLGEEWLSKEDAAQLDSYSDENRAELAIKGAYSDALKRAAVKFGIGRYLYAFKAPWVELDTERFLPFGFNGLLFMEEGMVPANELEELRAVQGDGASAQKQVREPAPPQKAEASASKPAPASQSEGPEKDDETLLAGIQDKILKGDSLLALKSYLGTEKVAARLRLETRRNLLLEIEKKLK